MTRICVEIPSSPLYSGKYMSLIYLSQGIVVTGIAIYQYSFYEYERVRTGTIRPV